MLRHPAERLGNQQQTTNTLPPPPPPPPRTLSGGCGSSSDLDPPSVSASASAPTPAPLSPMLTRIVCGALRLLYVLLLRCVGCVMGLWMWHKEKGAFVHVRLGNQHSTPSLLSSSGADTSDGGGGSGRESLLGHQRHRVRRRTGLGNYAVDNDDYNAEKEEEDGGNYEDTSTTTVTTTGLSPISRELSPLIYPAVTNTGVALATSWTSGRTYSVASSSSFQSSWISSPIVSTSSPVVSTSPPTWTSGVCSVASGSCSGACVKSVKRSASVVATIPTTSAGRGGFKGRSSSVDATIMGGQLAGTLSQVPSLDGDDAGGTAGTGDAMVATETTGLLPPNLMKSVSTPSIATDTKGHDIRQGSISDTDPNEGGSATPTRDGSPPCSIRRLLAEHDAAVQAKQQSSAGEEDEDADSSASTVTAADSGSPGVTLEKQPRRSMIDFLQPAAATSQPTASTTKVSSYEEGDRKKREPKEEKKRRSSVFSKFGSYRQKKVAKDNKLIRNTHSFVSVSFSNSTSCDVCSRFMANKPALQCENCMVNVHENTCKDQIAPCAPRLKASPSPRPTSKYQSASLPEGHGSSSSSLTSSSSATTPSSSSLQQQSSPSNNGGLGMSLRTEGGAAGPGASNVNLRGSHSFKECKRAASVPSTRPSLQVSHSGSNLQPRSSSPSKVICEEREKESPGSGENGTPPPKTPPVNNHMLTEASIVDALSVSNESLDDVSPDLGAELSDDPDLIIPTEAEPEAWSVTVDKKTLKKMQSKDIKRQDHMWEFIQTEKSHCRTLKLMRKVFAAGMLDECNIPISNVDRVFPRLNDLLDIHLHFLHALTDRQKLKPDKSIDRIGDILVDQFQGEMGMKMKVAYGEFCSQHNESVQLYKDLHKSDRKFQAFIKKCSRNNVCKRLGVPECILLVTQRMTKYPLLIESIIKATKDNKLEREALSRALGCTRDILNYVDMQVDAHIKEQQQIEIYNKLDARQSTLFRGKKFKKSDLLMHSRKLLHEGSIKWMSARGKPCEVIAVILSDLMFFLVENNQKYAFFTQDNKSSVISLSKLLVREKGDTRDSKGIYLICQSKTEPEMYELVCRSPDDRKAWVKTLRAAVTRCPEEDEGVPSESEEERRLLEARSAKMRQIVDGMHKQDSEIQKCCDEKMKMMRDMQELFIKEGEILPELKSIFKNEEEQELLEPDVILQEATNEVTRLLSLVSTLVAPPVLLPATSLYRSTTSVGEREHQTPPPPLPKRADTFSGFDGKDREKGHVMRRRYPSGVQESDDSSTWNSLRDLAETDSGYSLESAASSDKKGTEDTIDTAGKRTNLQRRQSVAVVKLEEQNKLPKERMSRRMSSSFLTNLLTTKPQQSPPLPPGSSASPGAPTAAPGESGGSESPATTDSSSQQDMSMLVPSSMREQCNCAATLLNYVHSLVAITSQQSTEVERFRAMLQEANSKVSSMYSDNHKPSSSSSAFQHDKQLEELRNLQEQVRAERDELSRWKANEQAAIDEQCERVRAEQEQLQRERDELRYSREDLKRQKEMLQRQMELFEERQRRGAQSPLLLGGGGVGEQAYHHKRTASDDLKQQQQQQLQGGAQSFNSLGASASPQPTSKKIDSTGTTMTNKSRSHSVSGNHNRKESMPLHLLSTTNEQKLHFSTVAGGGGANAASGSGVIGSSSSSIPQMLPHKLSVSSVSKHHRSSPVAATTQPSQQQAPPPPRLMHAKSQPSLNVLSTVVKAGGPMPTLLPSHHHQQAAPAFNVLPMKLAESRQRPKSAGAPASSQKSSSSSSPTSTLAPNSSSSSSKKKEENVLFF